MNPWRIVENIAYGAMILGLLIIFAYVLAAYATTGRN